MGLYGETQGLGAGKGKLNVASSGKCSSDRTISQDAAQIWKAQPCAVS